MDRKMKDLLDLIMIMSPIIIISLLFTVSVCAFEGPPADPPKVLITADRPWTVAQCTNPFTGEIDGNAVSNAMSAHMQDIAGCEDYTMKCIGENTTICIHVEIEHRNGHYTVCWRWVKAGLDGVAMPLPDEIVIVKDEGNSCNFHSTGNRRGK